MTTHNDLEAITARTDAATPGPWEHSPYGDVTQAFDLAEQTGPHEWRRLGIVEAQHIRNDDAEFIAHARADVPSLVAEIRELRASRESLRDRIEELRDRLEAERADVDEELMLRGYRAIDDDDPGALTLKEWATFQRKVGRDGETTRTLDHLEAILQHDGAPYDLVTPPELGTASDDLDRSTT